MMSLKKIALSSLLLLCGLPLLIQRVILSNYNKISVRQLARILNAPAPCQTPLLQELMNINFLKENDISKHFDSGSKLNIPGLGVFKGRDKIMEVIKMQKSSDFEDFNGFNFADGSKTNTGRRDRDFQFIQDTTNDECVVAVETVADVKLGNDFKIQSAIETSVNGKLKFRAYNGNLVFSEVSVDLPEDLVPTMAAKIKPTKMAKKVCEIMKEYCTDTWEENGFERNGMNKCRRAFKKLPSGEKGQTDGNTQACRIFQAAIVETSGENATDACDALSFSKSEGQDGCRDENVKKSEDFFGTEERKFFSDFKRNHFSNIKGFNLEDKELIVN